MNRKGQTRSVAFSIAALIFILLVLSIQRVLAVRFSILVALALLLGLLGLVLIALSVGQQEGRIKKAVFIVNGVSAAGMPISAILHNAVYGLFIKWHGKEVWGPAGDEPLFFILALFVFPALFLASALSIGVMMAKAKTEKRAPRQGDAALGIKPHE